MFIKQTWLRVLTGGAAAFAGAIGVATIAFFELTPNVPPPSDLRVQKTPEKLARGEYLFEHVAICADCHSTRDWSRFAGPITPGTIGQGGDRFGHEIGLPGDFFARNITPAALGDWSDGEIKRAMVNGVSKDGSPLFPIMPYLAFRNMCDRDIESIIAHVRTLKPIENRVPAPKYDFPMSLIVRTIPSPVETPSECPDPSDTVSYGKYLVTLASCADCHTQKAEGKPIAGLELAGGMTFPLPNGGTVTSKNLTPDAKTGLGDWTRERFVGRFKSMDHADVYQPVGPGDHNTIMPWAVYAGMTEEDLGAIYDYLRTIPAVRSKIAPPAQPIAAAGNVDK